MNLSNRLTFSFIFSFVLVALFVLAVAPAMAQTIEAMWVADYDDTAEGNQEGWNITLDGFEAGDDVTITYLDRAGTAGAETGTQAGFENVPDPGGTSTTGSIAATIGTRIAVQVVNATDTVTYQRVDFPVAGPNATLAVTDLMLLPKLMKLATPLYYVAHGGMVTVTFDFETPVADSTFGAPMADLHRSDVTLGTPAGWQYESVSGSDMITYRSTHADDATSVTSTVDIPTAANFAQAADTATDGQATLHYDGTAPTITAGTVMIAAPAGSPTPPDGVWGGAFPVFNLTFSVADDGPGSGLPDQDPVRIVTDTDKLDVGPVGLGTQDDTVDGTEYLVQITPKADRATTAGEDVVITIMPVDNAGNTGSMSTSVKLAMNVPPPAVFMSADPATGPVNPTNTITVTFDKAPENLVANGAALSGTGASRTLTVDANATAGPLTITLTWTGGRQVLSYTVMIPDVPAIAFTSAAPASGNVMAGDSITLTFAADPGSNVTASLGAISGTGTTRMLMIPAGQAAGEVTITVSWTMAGHEDGSTMLTYTITRPFVSSNPTSPSNISDPIEIPANSYLILVRDMDAMYKEASFSFPQVDGADVMIEEWPEMPDLEALFNRSSFGQGGVLVLRRSADARDNRMNDADGDPINEYATPARGSVGISEIMWALDEGQLNRDRQIQSQWIELHNVNSKPVKVLIYAQQGREPGLAGGMQLIRDGFVHNTLAGDTIVHKTGGDPSGMVVDAVTNINNKGDGREGGWDPKGDDGNSVTGDALTSMHRILPHNQPAYSAGQNYTKRDGRNRDSWSSADNIYARLETSQPGSATTNVVVITNYNGTPGQRNDYKGVTLHTKKPTTNLNDSPALVFNEIGNRATADRKYEWIEIRNTTGSPISLKTYIITTLTAVGTETILIRIPHNQAADVPKNGVLLLLASDPDGDPDHPLSVGYNIDEPYDDQEQGSKGDHVPRYKVVNFQGDGIPNGQFILVLRKPDDAGKNDISETGNADFDKIVDIAGHSTNLSKSIAQGGYPNPVSETSLWPLHSFPGSHSGNDMKDDSVWDRRRVNSKGNDLLGAGHWDGSPTFGAVGYTGIGYRRDVPSDGRYGGTPGYHNVRVNQVGSVTGDVVISELMLSTGSSTSRRLPQWIEITNNSLTKAINLKADSGWRLVIETPNDEIRTINFKDWDHGNYILPNQTVLIVAGSPTRNAPAGSDNLPTNIVFKDDRIFNVFREYGAGFTEIDDDFDDPRNDLTKSDRYRFLNQKQFHIELIDGKGTVADVVGNLDGNPRTNDTADWEYPDGLTLEKEGRNQYRTSFIRVFDDGTARTAVGSDEVDVLPLDPVRSGAVEAADLEFNDFGSVIPDKYAWIQAAVLNFDSIYVRHTWYGSEADFGTPGSLKGQPLPVALSFFRPTLEDGKVVIRWTTESELDNAGFNILRSDSRNGEFEQVNERLIQGNGTTAERSTYKWVDTTAKPGVVYYYQIEDVSFAGERETLTTTKLKGLISAKNKLATTWSELKSQN